MKKAMKHPDFVKLLVDQLDRRYSNDKKTRMEDEIAARKTYNG